MSSIILGIETSCDETSVALYCAQQGLLENLVYSQIDLHKQYGGVVPELASRDHVRKLLPLVKEALAKRELSLADIAAIAYTEGPGLVGALLVGAAFGRALAYALSVPAVAVHHMEGHLLSPLLADEKPSYPFVALLVSGGHSQLMAVRKPGDYTLLGESIDDAAGEAFDKTAKAMDLPYPGGPSIAKLAEQGNPNAFDFPRPLTKKPGCDFSFSGLKTAVLIALKKAQQSPEGLTDKVKADIAASFQAAVTDTLVIKCKRALKQAGMKTLVVGGGVSANKQLREKLAVTLEKMGGQAYYPPLALCSDNAAMIAYAGFLRWQAGERAELALNVRARWPLTQLAALSE